MFLQPLQQQALPERGRGLVVRHMHLDPTDGLSASDDLDEALADVRAEAAVQAEPEVQAGVLPQVVHHLEELNDQAVLPQVIACLREQERLSKIATLAPLFDGRKMLDFKISMISKFTFLVDKRNVFDVLDQLRAEAPHGLVRVQERQHLRPHLRVHQLTRVKLDLPAPQPRVQRAHEVDVRVVPLELGLGAGQEPGLGLLVPAPGTSPEVELLERVLRVLALFQQDVLVLQDPEVLWGGGEVRFQDQAVQQGRRTASSSRP